MRKIARVASIVSAGVFVAAAGCTQGAVRVSLPYGARYDPNIGVGGPYPLENSEGRGYHLGIDIPSPFGSPVLAAANGVVESAVATSSACGTRVVIVHAGFQRRTVSCHLSKIADGVQGGVPLRRGDVVGYVGRTGVVGGQPHAATKVHFEVRSLAGEPEDPEKVIIGCFDAKRTFPEEGTPAFTWPVRC